MNIISVEKQKKILELTFEGESIRSISKRVRVRWETARKYHDLYEKEIERAENEIESKINGELDQLDKDGLLKIIKTLLHL